ncbi:MAG: bifunctional glutamate N-acetyltransferase/amino-acid acetyltransferase ArgJ [Opitutae bacterium]|nr:bifunctional glutamate N-acetyltransferase/amino-acid acetyltransferase ArgJ [Opitutae bacterium]
MTGNLIIQNDIAAAAKVPSFKVNGVSCDVRCKDDDCLDLCLVHSISPCTAAGVFTKNDVQAAPVLLSRKWLASGEAFHGFVCNSGNANACTGDQGLIDAENMALEAIRYTNSSPGSFLVCSTGRIGELLPMDRIIPGIRNCTQNLGNLPEHGERTSRSILTSDTCPKGCLATWEMEGEELSIGGFAKGAGMIEPNMATMLAFLLTDVKIHQELLREVLSEAVNKSFNRITIDGDMSTNDTVLMLANGASGKCISEKTPQDLQLFQEAVGRICLDLAEKIVSDGERITKVVRVEVKSAPDDETAEKVCRSIANSLLVKTSWYGGDPNWGRIVHAAGYAQVGLEMDKVDLYYDDALVLLAGAPQTQNRSSWKTVVNKDRFTIQLNLNLGTGSCTVLSADLTEGYVDFNKSE